ncbi:hypothetical protein FR943_15030 [Mycobacterium sp. TNTM28]|uniref:Uncharacterized protein n=1 Tax=[Mycobacterium] fortunisiensis TaxID=2600579 RepID=A0ABS6KNK5_9MYCO|nr:hypothetical protein [[Mycobacterium] fortunisiensis]MBU9765152.1 hypothetical protein [[Mycobacterium] fortunisiensis]
MTAAQRTALSASGVKLAISGLTVAAALLATAGHAIADPVADPGVPGPPPAPTDPALAAPPPPAPAGPPQVPEIANPVYGSGQYGSGPVGTLRDLWHQAHDPYGFQGAMDAPQGVAPPPGAGPPPPLPPGYVSINAPGSETPVTAPEPGTGPSGPPLPPGYYSLNGPPPPGYEYNSPGQPPAPAPPAPAP